MTEPIDTATENGPRACRDAERHRGLLQDDEHVTVYRLAMTHRPFIEGTATVLGAFDEARDLYWVRFAGETVPRLRCVQAGSWQSDPDATLRALLAHWRDARSPETLAPVPSDDTPAPHEGQ